MMSAGGDDHDAEAMGGALVRADAARLLLDALLERDLTPSERRESLALLNILLDRPTRRRPRQPSARHPSVSSAIAQLGHLESRLLEDSPATSADHGPIKWECAFVGQIAVLGPCPPSWQPVALGEIADTCLELQQAIDWHQPFAAAAWSGLRLTGGPVFNPADGRFTGYCGTMEVERVRRLAPIAPSPDDEARLAHEVRSPLGAIVGFADMIVQQSFGPAPIEMQAGARRILETGARLLSALDDMTDAARLDLGHYPVELGWINARPVVDRAIARFASLAADRQATLRAVGGQSLWMQVDEQALLRLVERLLAGILGLAGPQELFELEAIPIAGDRVSIALSRPACLAGWTSDELRNPGIEIESSDHSGQVVPMVGLGFALRLVSQLADRLGGSFVVEPHRFVVNLPALQTLGVVNRAGAI